LTGEGRGEGEGSGNSNKLFIPLAFIPSRQGRGNLTFYEAINFDEIVKSPQNRFSVIPVETGIQSFQ
jgi:hypothetical protein